MSRYAQSHETTHGPGDARPTALQIVEDEGLTGRLTDKVFLITGVSSGIGIETLRALYSTGAHVFGTVRNLDKGRKVVDKIEKSTKGGKITLIEMELASLASIKKGVDEILRRTDKLNVLINNAGIIVMKRSETQDGFESQFGTCHLSHFYLFQLLKPLLLASSTPSSPSRVVTVSSIGHRLSSVRLHDYHFLPGEVDYDPWLAYGSAKTANIWFSNELERRYGSRGIHATSLHPGGAYTGLSADLGESLTASFDTPKIRAYMKSPAQGAATSVYAAVSAEWKGKGGKYLSNCVEEKAFGGGEPMEMGDDGFAEWAYDEEGEGRLWGDSLGMVGLGDDR